MIQRDELPSVKVVGSPKKTSCDDEDAFTIVVEGLDNKGFEKSKKIIVELYADVTKEKKLTFEFIVFEPFQPDYLNATPSFDTFLSRRFQ
jgi:hypothetical protein